MRIAAVAFVGDKESTKFGIHEGGFAPAPRPDGWTVLTLRPGHDVWVRNDAVKYISVYDETSR